MRSIVMPSSIEDRVGSSIRKNLLYLTFAAFALMLALPAHAVIVNVGGGIPTGMEIEDTPDAAANKTTEDSDTDGTGVSYDWNDLIFGAGRGPYTHDQMIEVDPIGNPGVFTDFTFDSLGVVETVFNTDDTTLGAGCVGGDEDGFTSNVKINTNPYAPILVDPNNKTDSCSGAAALEIVNQINNDTGEEQNHYILYNYWTRTFDATGSMITYQVLRGPQQFNPDTVNPVVGVDPEYRCDDFLVKFDLEPNTNSVVVSSLTWKPNGTGAPPYTNAECAGPGAWQLFDSDFDGDPGPDTGGGVGNFGFNDDPVDTGEPNGETGTFGESGVDLTALGILPEDGPCSVFTNQGFITATGNSANPGVSDIMAYDTPLVINNCTDVEISKVVNAPTGETFEYVLDQEDMREVHDDVGSLEDLNGLGVDTDASVNSITSLINPGDTHLWHNVLAQPDYMLDEINMPADWTQGTVICTYYDPFDLVTRVDQILPEQNDGPWDQAGGVDDPDTFVIPPESANNGIVSSCVISNVTSGLIIEKNIEQGAIGTATLDDFNVSVDGVEVMWTTPGSTTSGSEQVTALAGTYTLMEADHPSYTEGTWTCVDGLGVDVNVTNGGAFDAAEVEVLDGQIVTCSITNERLASLTVVKNAAGGNAEFDFASTKFNNFVLDTGVINTAQITFDNLVPATDYNLVEIIETGWNLSIASCSNDSGTYSNDGVLGGLDDISLSVGEGVTCTFNNIQQGSSALTKITIGGDGSFDYSSNFPNLPSMDGSFSLATAGGSSPPLAGDGLIPGVDYSVTEAAKAGWTLTDISCTPSGDSTTWQGDIGTRTLDFNLAVGESIDCEFTNTQDGTVIVEKQTIGGDPADQFTFTGDLNGPLLDGETLTLSGNFALAVTSTEVVPGNYTLTDITCSGGTNASTVMIGGTASFEAGDTDISVLPAPGETITCVYTNTKKGTITVVKEITDVGPAVQDFGFTSNLPGNASFDLSPIDAATSDELQVIDLVPGIYSVSETNPNAIGWHLISSSCDDTSPIGAIDLGAGEDIVCTFINAPLGSATIVKVTEGADGGPFGFTWGNGTNTNVPEGSASTFDLTTPGPTATMDFTDKLLIGEAYDLSETGLPAAVGPYSQTWNLTNTECVDATDDTSVPGDNGADATIIAASNETVACEFTNTLDGTLVIRKQTLPDGDTTDFVFDGTHAGLVGSLQDYENANAELSETGAPGIYGATETVPAGWVLTDISCEDASSSTVVIGTGNSNPDIFEAGDTTVQVDLAAGETVICTFTNSKDGSLSIVKNAVGDDGVFSFNHDVPMVQTPAMIDTEVDPLNILSTTLQPGTYLVSEVVPTGWDLTNIVCEGATDSIITIGGEGAFDMGDTAVTVELLSGENIVCAFTNTRRTTQVTLQKQWINGVTGDTADLSVTGPSGASPAAQSAATGGDQLDTDNTAVLVELTGNTVTLGETLGGQGVYTTQFVCEGALNDPMYTDGATTATLLLDADDTAVTCTYTNTLDTVELTLQKAWVGGIANDTAGLTASGINGALFTTATATGGDETSAETVIITALVGETVTLSEVLGGLGDYTANFDCASVNDPTYNAGDLSATLLIDATDQPITCTFTNTIVDPIINLAKTVNGPATLELDGSYTVVYSITASNTGGYGTYNVVDTFSPGSGITLNTATAQYLAGTEADLSGDEGPYPNFVSNEGLAAGLNESWTVTANFTVDPTMVDPVDSQCDPGAPTINTGFYNRVTGSDTDSDLSDNDTCTGLPEPGINLAKTVNGPATLELDGTYTVVYTITAINSGGPGMYNLVDTFSPGSGITLNTATAEYLAGTEADQSGEEGAYPNFVSNEGLADGLNESWTVTANFTVDPAMVDPVDSQCDPAVPAINTGFYNFVTGSDTDRDLSDNDTCTGLPEPGINLAKEVNGPAVMEIDGTFTVVYTITATNTGGPGSYDLVDTFSPGSGITLNTATAEYLAGTEADQSGEEGAYPNFVTAEGLADGLNESWTVTANFTIDPAMVDPVDSQCDPAAPAINTGFYNLVTGSDTDTDLTDNDACTGLPVGQLTVMKTVIGGTAVPEDFMLTLTGTDGTHDAGQDYVSGDMPTVDVGVEYTLSELADQVPDYVNGGVVCTDDNAGGTVDHPVTINAGQSVTCTVTNRLVSIPPPIIAVPVNNPLALLLLTLMMLAAGLYFKPATVRKQ